MDAVPFEMPSPLVPFVIVAAEVNDREPVKVLLDTGAAAPFTILVSPDLARRSGASSSGEPPVPSTGAVGAAPVAYQPARIGAFRLGSLRLSGVRAGITAAVTAVGQQIGTKIDAIVGHEFLKARVVSIDYTTRLLDLSAPPGPEAQAIRFRLAPKRALTLVDVRLNGCGPFVMALDTGASATLVSPHTAKRAGLNEGRGAALAGGGGLASEGAQLTTATVSIGTVSRSKQNVAVADVLGPIQTAAGAPLDGVLGADFLSSGRITIDYPGKRLWIQSATAETK
jgi:predicted aspartyl protease